MAAKSSPAGNMALAMTVASNAYVSKESVGLVKFALNGDYDKARVLYRALIDLFYLGYARETRAVQQACGEHYGGVSGIRESTASDARRR